MAQIRKELPADRVEVYKLNVAAFGGEADAEVVNQLRSSCPDYHAYVAVHDNQIVGHIVFTPTSIDGCSVAGMGLAPMAVEQSYQGRGIGSQLVQYGLEQFQASDCPYVLVLGHPEYYPRFGFELASRYRLESQWEGVPDEAFMILVFDESVLPSGGGVARYRDEFDSAM